jgi:non-specific serine/threonine protein kinase/serine/threonine-protein kinase
MEPERLQEIEKWYQAALERNESERSAFLREVSNADESLRCEVESQLAYDKKAQVFLESPAVELAAQELARDEVLPPALLLPFRIGHYQILRVLGEGGMGVVYEAEQGHPRRTVALKVIKPGLVSRELLRRFEQESQALGRLQHPGIAQIHEAGTADSGLVLRYGVHTRGKPTSLSGCAPTRHHSPRLEARQHPGGRHRPAKGVGLWSRAGDG